MSLWSLHQLPGCGLALALLHSVFDFDHAHLPMQDPRYSHSVPPPTWPTCQECPALPGQQAPEEGHTGEVWQGTGHTPLSCTCLMYHTYHCTLPLHAQGGAHDSAEDARAALELVRLKVQHGEWDG